MDFLDKLTQRKSTTSEPRKSGSSAEAEQIAHLQQQLQSCEHMLQELETAVGQTANAARTASANSETVMQTAQQLQTSVDGMAQSIQTSVDGATQSMQVSVDEMSQRFQTSVDESVQKLQASVAQTEALMQQLQTGDSHTDEALAKIQEANTKAADTLLQIQASFARTDDTTHRECVRVYRNVEAALVEDLNKQTDELKTVISSKGSQKALLPLSIITLILVAADIALQVLGYFF